MVEKAGAPFLVLKKILEIIMVVVEVVVGVVATGKRRTGRWSIRKSVHFSRRKKRNLNDFED